MSSSTEATSNPGVIAVADVDTAGAIVWWRLSGPLALDKLEGAWDAAGLDSALLPKNPSPAECVARAMRTHQSKRVLARPLGGRKGWALVTESPTADGDLDYTTMAKAHLDDDKRIRVEGADDLKHGIEGAFVHHRQTLAATDVSMWLSGTLIGKMEAIKLRDTGGVYFVPRQHLDTFRAWAGLLRGISDHVVYEVPALQSDEAVEAILAALMAEADHEIGAMETELDTEDLGKRALKTREAKCGALRIKLATYAELLGVSMEQTSDRLEHVQAALVEAAMAGTDDGA